MLVNERQAAEMLCTTPGALRVLRCTGGRPGGMSVPPYVRLGRKIAYDVSDLQRYIDQHKVDPTGGGAAA